MLFEPYTGNEPFAYILSATSDDNITMPFIERAAQQGLRIWFDHNLRTNALQWQQKTRMALNECTVVIAILSNESTDNHVYRKQLTACIELGKPLFIISVNQPILTIGVAKQAERALGYISSSGKVTDDEITCILEHVVIKKCLGQSNPSIVIHDYETQKDEIETKNETLMNNADPSEETIAELGGITISEIEEHKQQEVTGKKDGVPPTIENQRDTNESTVVPASKVQLDATIVPTIPIIDDADATVVIRTATLPAIVSLISGKYRSGLFGEMTIGRATENGKGIYADISFPNETAYLSRKHFQIISIEGKHIIKCLSVNGINIDGLKELQQDETCEVGDVCVVKVPGKHTKSYQEPMKDSSLFVVAFDDKAECVRNSTTISAIMSVDTGEIKVLFEDQFFLGRNNPWQSKAMTSKTISREQGTLSRTDETYSLEQVSNVGCRINNAIIRKGEKHILHNEDSILFLGSADVGIPDEHFLFINISIIEK